MRAVDIMFSMPGLLIALVFVLVLGPGERNLIIALTVNAWMVFTRLVRGHVVAMRDGPMVEAARAVGVPRIPHMVRHILPNMLGLVVTISVLEVARIMLAEATMSFLGYGIQPPAVSWGVLIGHGRDYVSNDPVVRHPPGHRARADRAVVERDRELAADRGRPVAPEVDQEARPAT